MNLHRISMHRWRGQVTLMVGTIFLNLSLMGFFSLSSIAYAGRVEGLLGPAGAGNGGTNPLSIPPVATDIDLRYVTDSDEVYSLSIVPGLFAGKRFYKGPWFATLGGGLVISSVGANLGIFSALGFKLELFEDMDFMMELKQALTYDEYLLSPYAIRLGVSYAL